MLQICCGVDYRDRWRTDPATGRPLLTLRRLWVLIRHLPPDSPLMVELRGGREHWTLEAHLLDDLRMVWTGDEKRPPKPHPGRFPDLDEPADTGPTEAELAAARERAAAHRSRFAAD